MKLREIAREMDCSVGTVKSRYQSAFRLIVGHDYTAELWDRLFAAYKFQKYLDGSCSTRRPRRSRLPGRAQIVNETDLRQATQGQGSTRIESLHHSIYADVRELLAEIRDLVQKGWDDQRIVNELSLTTNRAVEIVQWARKHPDVDVDVE